MTQKKLQKEVKKITDVIVKKYKPEKIILFGSAVSGKNFHQESDIDLLVIKETDEPYWERVRRLINECLADFWTPTDIFILTPSELEKAKKENRFFLTEEILPKGRVVYEKTY